MVAYLLAAVAALFLSGQALAFPVTASMGGLQYQEFTSSGTFYPPRTAVYNWTCIGAGGGGGSGTNGSHGGQGGNSGQVVTISIQLSTQVYVSIGQGGAAATAGGATAVGSFLVAAGGQGGATATNSTNNPGYWGIGGAGGSSGGANAGAAGYAKSVTTTTVASGTSLFYAMTSWSVGKGLGGEAGAGYSSQPGGGGGGGGIQALSTVGVGGHGGDSTTSGPGGNGTYGAGGGGGAAVSSQAGGTGGNGYCVVTW